MNNLLDCVYYEEESKENADIDHFFLLEGPILSLKFGIIKFEFFWTHVGVHVAFLLWRCHGESRERITLTFSAVFF
jgi:hypothetical protein